MALEVVAGAAGLPDPPYPVDVRANGWNFQLDTTRMRASDTWTLARPEMRPWLLLLWIVAWEETPCGTLPCDDELIVAKLGIDAGLFHGHRSVLMRGWKRHGDDRLYHSVITEHVHTMCEARVKDRERVRKWRETQKNKRNALVTRDLRVSNATGSGSGSGSGSGENQNHSGPASPSASRAEKVKRGTRLSEDWTIPDEWLDWAMKMHNLDRTKAVRLSLEFRDYWTGVPGSRGCKTNWLGTWRNKVRRYCGDA